MLTSKKVKEVAKKLRADLIGIASIERFEECVSGAIPI